MSTRGRRTVLVVVLVLIVGAPVVAQLAGDATPVKEEIPVTTDQTPTIYLQSPGGFTDVDLVDMWAGDELNLITTLSPARGT